MKTELLRLLIILGVGGAWVAVTLTFGNILMEAYKAKTFFGEESTKYMVSYFGQGEDGYSKYGFRTLNINGTGLSEDKIKELLKFIEDESGFTDVAITNIHRLED